MLLAACSQEAIHSGGIPRGWELADEAGPSSVRPGQRRKENGAVTRLRESKEMLLFTSSTLLLLAGGAAWLMAAGTPASILWVVGTLLGLAFSLYWTVGAIRRRQPSVDVIAVLALAGALAVDEPFAGAMITVMLASGQLLEARAAARARRELSPVSYTHLT